MQSQQHLRAHGNPVTHRVLIRLAAPALALAIALTGSGPGRAQTANATLNGTILDATGATVPGAKITLTNTQTAAIYSNLSESDGRYSVLNLTPGSYTVEVSKEGFSTIKRLDQQFFVGQTVTLDFNLSLSSVMSTVEVNAAEAPIIETTESVVSKILDTRDLDTLPVLNRSFAQLATMTPGVQSQGQSYGGTGSLTSAAVSIGNSPTYQTGYMVDGLTNETGNQGGQYVNLSQDWVQEFSVITLQFPAEYGEASAGVVNSVMRSGGNAYHGRAYAFLQTSELNSNPEFYTGKTKAPFNSQRTGGYMGGPIRKDKLFFFAGYEYFHNFQTSTINTSAAGGSFYSTAQTKGTPSASLVPWLEYGTATSLPTVNTSNLAMVKLDYNLTPRDTINARGNLDWEAATNSGFGGATTFGAASNAWDPNYADMVSWTRTMGPSAVNTVSFGYFDHPSRSLTNYCQAVGTYGGGVLNANPYNYVTPASLGGLTPFGDPSGVFATVTYNGVSTGGQCGGVLDADTSSIINEQYSHTHNNHEFRTGGYVRKYYTWSRNAHNQTDGSFTFGATPGPFNPNTPIAQTFTSAGYKAATQLAPTTYTIDFPSNPALDSWNLASYSYGGFAQDSWKITQGLTLNLGLRYDFSTNNSSLSKDSFPALSAAVPGTHGFIKPGFHNINNDPYDLSPRIGFAWVPKWAHQNTVIRGGWGLFYDQNDTASVAVYVAGNAWAPSGYSLSAGTATQNPYCIGNNNCASGIPAQYEIAVLEVLSSALANYTLPQFPNANAACAATASCTVTVGPNTYNIPALTVSANPQGNLLDLAPNYPVPGTMQVTGGVQHQFGNSLSVAADYVYRYGFHEIVTVNNNVAQTGTGSSQTYTTVNPAYTTGYQLQAIAQSQTNDLDVQATYHDHRSDLLQVAYQFGHESDDDYTNFSISAHNALTTDPFNLKVDQGPGSLDAHNILNIAGNLNMHWGIELAPLISYTSGFPFNATSSLQTPGSSGNCPVFYARCYPVLNGTNYSRDSLRGDSFFSLNSRLSKSVHLPHEHSLTGYFEGYNITNKHNLGTNYFTNVDASNFRQPNGTSLPLRQFQFGGRIDF
jgi:hypothetical protein